MAAHEALLKAVVLADRSGDAEWVVRCGVPALREVGVGVSLPVELKREAWLMVVSWASRPRLFNSSEYVLRFISHKGPNPSRSDACNAVWASCLRTRSAFELADFIGAKTVEESLADQYFECLVRTAGFPINSANFTPSSFVSMLNRSHSPNAGLYLEASAFMLALRAKQSSLMSLASALRAWAKFCDFLKAPHLPVCTDAAIKFCAIFRESGTFGAYLAHLKSACELLQLPVDWASAPSLGRAKKGLAKASLACEGPRLAVLGADILRLASVVPWSYERFFCIFSWVFLLRENSEASGLYRDFDTPLVENLYTPLPDGVGGAVGMHAGSLVVRLRARKAHLYGDRVLRGCCCGGAQATSFIPTLLCPVHVLWPWVCSRVDKGERIFSDQIGARALIWLRAALLACEVENAERFGLHALRRGAAQQLVDSGGDLPMLLRAGGWRSSAFRSYLDMVDIENRVLSATIHALVDLDHVPGE